jgi:DNA-damage-inducible protein J
MKTVKMNIRVNKDIKEKAEKVFSSLGLTNSQAVNMFFSQVILNNGIPFDIKIPSYYNKKTMKVIEDAENGEGLLSCNSTEDFFKDLKI